ncbi:MAG: methionine adenosyltransferase [Hydrotalea sp.]|nr:methionine adenosyltransferase [Hydrotalea sp.]
MSDYLFTSESVSEGHPDKICDRISDEVLDMFIKKEKYARVACETLATTQRVVIAGEIKLSTLGNGKLVDTDPATAKDIEAAVRAAVRDIGYEQDGFHWKNLQFENLLHSQSADIAMGVDNKDKNQEGAGDQGIMFGYATNETPSFMPATLDYSHRILKSLSEFRRMGKSGLGPDAKSQVTLLYQNGKPTKATSVVVSTQHDAGLTQQQVRDIVMPHIEKILPKGWMPKGEDIYVNPTGNFVIGGPDGDAGLTGRKIIVDTYGGAAPHGGGAFSGKDPSKVDRSAAYAARYLAKNIVAAGLCDKCVIQISYAIGVAKPLSVYVNTYGTGKVPEEKIVAKIDALVNLSPWGIREKLDLHRAIYVPTSSYGHFGRDAKDGLFPWEKLDLVDGFRG